MQVPRAKTMFEWVEVALPRLCLRFGVRTHVIAVAVVALGLVGWSVVERAWMPQGEVSTCFLSGQASPDRPNENLAQVAASEARDYFRSLEAIKDVRTDRFTATLSSPPAPSDLERIRVTVEPNTNWVRCFLHVNHPIRDTAILNAAVSSMVRHHGRDPASTAAPPRLPSLLRRGVAAVVYSLFALFMCKLSSVLIRALLAMCREVWLRRMSSTSGTSVL